MVGPVLSLLNRPMKEGIFDIIYVPFENIELTSKTTWT